jgi:hypothetical protein
MLGIKQAQKEIENLITSGRMKDFVVQEVKGEVFGFSFPSGTEIRHYYNSITEKKETINE